MKLIIDIAEKYYETCKDAVKEGYPSQLEETIGKGIPVDTSGDLISREALKKEFINPPDRDYLSKSLLELVYKRIDNASTVELSPVINMKPLTAEEKQGLIDALKKSRLKVVKLDDIEGIRGEWARHDEWVNGEYVGGFYHVNCPVIEEGYALYSRWETRFCPNCGAPMLKGGDDA